MKSLFAYILIFLAVLAVAARAESPAKTNTKVAQEFSKKLDFDGDVVEGMNRQPLDSLTSVSEGDGDGANNRLYRRKKKAEPENRELAREIVETY
jgi:hypothetical protein